MLIYVTIGLIFLTNLPAQCRANCKGCVELNDLTFGRVTKRFPVSILKFDIAYPYGDRHEQFVQFAGNMSEADDPTVDDLLIVHVGIKDYGEKDNENLAKRFRVGTQYPEIKLYFRTDPKLDDVHTNDDGDYWINFSSDLELTVENLKEFLRKNTDIYIGLPGCIREFDQQAKEFSLASEKGSMEAEIVLKSTENLQSKWKSRNDIEETNTKIYPLLMRRILDKGWNFVEDERKRLVKLLEGKIGERKRKELKNRLNILLSFSEPKIRDKNEL